MSSSTIDSKKFISSNNELYQASNSRNSFQLRSSYEDPVLQSQSWSDSRIKNEISSFLAQYSYLGNRKEERTSQQNRPRISLQTYQVYPADFYDKNPNKGFYLNKNRSKTSIEPKRKSIAWKDGKTPHFKHSEDKTKPHLLRRPINNDEWELNPSLIPNDNKHMEDDKYLIIRERPKSNQRLRSNSKRRLSHREKKHRPRSPSKNRSKSGSIKRTSLRKIKHRPRVASRNKSKPKMKIRSSKYPFTHTKTKMRAQPTESHIKYIPLRYEKKSRRRRVMRPEPVPKTPLMSPSVVTLYPRNRIQEELLLPYNQYLDSNTSCKCNQCQKKNVRKRSKRHRESPIRNLNQISSPSTITIYPNNPTAQEELIFPYDAEFFIDSHKSCKCHKCIKKRKSVIKMSKRKRCNNKKFKPCFDLINCQDWCYEKEVCLREPTRCCTSQAEIDYESSLNFKFNSYCQHFDPKITQYFYSILDQADYL